MQCCLELFQNAQNIESTRKCVELSESIFSKFENNTLILTNLLSQSAAVSLLKNYDSERQVSVTSHGRGYLLDDRHLSHGGAAALVPFVARGEALRYALAGTKWPKVVAQHQTVGQSLLRDAAEGKIQRRSERNAFGQLGPRGRHRGTRAGSDVNGRLGTLRTAHEEQQCRAEHR
jgi:hypothetical protein